MEKMRRGWGRVDSGNNVSKIRVFFFFTFPQVSVIVRFREAFLISLTYDYYFC